MKIPKEILVKGKTYEIKLIKTLIKDEEAEGTCDEATRTIKIDSSLKGDSLKSCLLHEIGHAIQYETGMAQGFDEALQEIITDNFANVLTDLITWRFR